MCDSDDDNIGSQKKKKKKIHSYSPGDWSKTIWQLQDKVPVMCVY